jgi:hypothetical protein
MKGEEEETARVEISEEKLSMQREKDVSNDAASLSRDQRRQECFRPRKAVAFLSEQLETFLAIRL